MNKVNRRSFIKGASAVAGAAGFNSANASLLDGLLGDDVPTTTEQHNVIVIGSGFGGGVAALRLGEAGAQVTVLERGKWWTAGPDANVFPRASNPDNRALWYETTPIAANKLRATPMFSQLGLGLEPHAGVLEPIVNPNLTVVCASGVGGGSLAYQGMALQPTETIFNNIFPGGVDYAEMDSTFYPMVADMLQLATAPDDLIAHDNYTVVRAFKQHAEEAGYSVEKIPMPIDWSWAQRELDGEMAPSLSNGDCALGVNNNGKHSVDETYIKQALATGNVTVNALHNVKRVTKNDDGTWTVYADRTDDTGRVLEHKVLNCNALVMAAGCTGTLRLLMRAAHHNDIPDMPSALGKDWGTNADRIFAWNAPTEDFGPAQGGPVVYGSKEWDDPAMANTVIQASIPPIVGGDIHTTMLVGFGYSDARGQWVYDPVTDNIVLLWEREADLEVHQRIIQRTWDIAGPGSVVVDSHLAAPMTWHPLGGASMGLVCDTEGRVFNHEGLYVLDGALVPGNTGACNPSMTIAAIAERAAHYLVRSERDAALFGISTVTDRDNNPWDEWLDWWERHRDAGRRWRDDD